LHADLRLALLNAGGFETSGIGDIAPRDFGLSRLESVFPTGGSAKGMPKNARVGRGAVLMTP